jgi:hypothetical protein
VEIKCSACGELYHADQTQFEKYIRCTCGQIVAVSDSGPRETGDLESAVSRAPAAIENHSLGRKEPMVSQEVLGQRVNAFLRALLGSLPKGCLLRERQSNITEESDHVSSVTGEPERAVPTMLERRQATRASLNDIYDKYWTGWILALILYMAHRWIGGFVLALLFTFLLSVLLWEMVIPTIGLIWALGRMEQWMTIGEMRSMPRWARNNLVLATLNVPAVTYSMSGIWRAWPYVWALLLFSALVSLQNGTCTWTGKT